MFLGEYRHSIDSKGRLAIPVKMRSKLAKGAVVTKGLDGCLVLYAREEWNVLADKLAQMPISKANSRAFTRLMLAGAMEVEFDSQGRIILPEYLRIYANLTTKAVVTGLYNRLEIWNEFAWDKYREKTEKSNNEIAENLGDLNINI